jgi:hypothetical protein
MLFPRNRPPVIEGAITDVECLKTVIISSAELGAFLLENSRFTGSQYSLYNISIPIIERSAKY